MTSHGDVATYLLDGKCPSVIALSLGITTTSVIDTLWICVGHGSLRTTDIYFAFTPEQRTVLATVTSETAPAESLETLQRVGLTPEELELFIKIRTQQVIGTGLYDLISDTELAIHEFARRVLVTAFGRLESEWWRKGVPLPIRQKCQSRREEDDTPSDSVFAYTDLIDLSEIIVRNWNVFKDGLHVDYQTNRKRLQHDFVRLNEIRKAVMHPVKRRAWTEDDYDFVRKFRKLFWSMDSADLAPTV